MNIIFLFFIIFIVDLNGKVIKITSNRTLKDQFIKNDYTYIIDTIYDAKGEIVTLPLNSTLKFENRGLLRDATIIIKSYSKILNGIFEYDTRANVYKTQYKRNIHAALIVECDSNIIINNCKFIINTDKHSDNKLSIAVLGYKYPSKYINISNCTFKKYGVGFFSNTCKSSIFNSSFYDMYHALSVETLYDKKPYLAPYDIKIHSNNFDIIKNIDLRIASIWISGINKLEFSNNKIKAFYNPIMIYCGDGNISLNDVFIKNNKFTISRYILSKTNTTIQVVGKSFVFMNKHRQFGNNIIIDNNTFEFISKSQKNQNSKVRAIAAMFVSDIYVTNNIIIGYDEGIVAFDSYRGFKQKSTMIKLHNNLFSGIKDNAIIMDNSILDYKIIKNKYEK